MAFHPIPLVIAASLLAAAVAPDASGPAAPNVARAGDFMVVQVSTTHPDRFVADWDKPGERATLHVEHDTVRGEPNATFLTLKGCTPDPAGLCDVTAVGRAVGPDGKITGPGAFPVYVKLPAPPSGEFRRSQAAFTVAFDKGDASGPYRVEVATTDNVSHVVLHTVFDLTLRDVAPPPGPAR